MNAKIGLLSVVMLTVSVCSSAQTARNPLNYEPARVMIKKKPSSWKLIEETFYRTDGTQFDKRSFTYDANGRVLSEVNQRNIDGGKSWQNISKYDYTYMDNKSIAISSKEGITGWQNTSKVETVSNQEGKATYSLSYSWNGSTSDWSIDPSLKCEWVYDENGRVSEYTKQYRNKETNEWNDSYARIIYSYNEDGEIFEESYQLWNVEHNLWVDAGKYNYSKGDENQKITISYIYASGKWVQDGKIVYMYDVDGKVTRGDFFGNSKEESLSAYCLYSYSEGPKCPVISDVEDINIYPNPAVSSFELTVADALVGKVANILDVWGKHAKSVIVSGNKTQVDVRELPKGIYVLHVGEKTKKLVVR